MAVEQVDEVDEVAGQVGDAGEIVNDSFASSAMNAEPDAERIQQYDHIKELTNFFPYAVWSITVLMVGSTAYLFARGHWIFGVFGLLLSAFACLVSFYAHDNIAVKKMAYKDGLLTPAIIVNTDPIEIIALTNMRCSVDCDDIFGCRKMRVDQLPLHEIALGEKVPCASLFMGSTDGRHKRFNTRPICWGFDDATMIHQAVESISNDEDYGCFDSVWDMLDKARVAMRDQPCEKTVLFDAQMNPFR